MLASLTGLRAQGTSDILVNYTGSSATYLNPVVGTDIFYNAGYLGENTVIANVEGGNIWYGHEAFVRPGGLTSSFFTFSNTAAGGVDELDYHATAVGNVLAGTGYSPSEDSYFFVGVGIAPYASLWSAGIATGFSASNLGEFSTTTQSTIEPYKAFFNGVNGQKADVINSSWGGTDPAGNADETIAIDGLARQNSTVAFVVSAGNSDTAAPGGPGSGYNGITVGSVGGPSFRDPSEFSSRGPADFFNPETGETWTGVRAAVDIAAPGERIVAAAYLGESGSIGASTDPDIQEIVQTPSPTDQYFTSLDGTSFSAPIVAGGVALLKDVAKSPVYADESQLGADALDTRVIKSVIMAGAAETNGWNNGQTNEDGVIVTEQALDYATGAGALDLETAALIYVSGTSHVDLSTGGAIASQGWDLADVDIGLSNTYMFDDDFFGETELTISLNWFVGREFDNDADLSAASDFASDLSFANLNLQVWYYAEGVDPLLVAESITLYNNTEFLRISLENSGAYGITVVFDGMVYDLTSGGVTSETYGLAWQAVAVPEPSTVLFAVLGSGVLLVISRRKRE